MEYRKSILWFIGGILIGISLGLFFGGAYGFLFAGVFILFSLFVNHIA